MEGHLNLKAALLHYKLHPPANTSALDNLQLAHLMAIVQSMVLEKVQPGLSLPNYKHLETRGRTKAITADTQTVCAGPYWRTEEENNKLKNSRRRRKRTSAGADGADCKSTKLSYNGPPDPLCESGSTKRLCNGCYRLYKKDFKE